MAARSATTRRHTALPVATVGIALVGILTVVRGIDVPPRCGTIPASQCTYTYHDPTTSKTYVYDFSSLCTEGDYAFPHDQTQSHSYVANICGSTHTPCFPATWTDQIAFGVATQFWGTTPQCHEIPQCRDNTGFGVCCTADCEVLGVGAPTMSLIDPSNPETGGVRLQHQGVMATKSDPNQCPVNPATKTHYPRTVIYDLMCNKSVTGLAQPVSVLASTECRYLFTFSTAKACGVAAPPTTTTGSGSTTGTGGSTTTGDHGGGGGPKPVVIVLIVVVVLLSVAVIALLAVYKPWQDRCGRASGPRPRQGQRLIRRSSAGMAPNHSDDDTGASAEASVDVGSTALAGRDPAATAGL